MATYWACPQCDGVISVHDAAPRRIGGAVAVCPACGAMLVMDRDGEVVTWLRSPLHQSSGNRP